MKSKKQQIYSYLNNPLSLLNLGNKKKKKTPILAREETKNMSLSLSFDGLHNMAL